MDDRHWKWGMVYINRADPALLVEKRFGVGWTLNLGRPVCWVLLLSLLAWPLFLLIIR